MQPQSIITYVIESFGRCWSSYFYWVYFNNIFLILLRFVLVLKKNWRIIILILVALKRICNITHFLKLIRQPFLMIDHWEGRTFLMESNDNLNCLDLAYSISCALVHRTQFTQYKYSNTLINCWIINLHSGIYVLLFFWRYFSVWTTLFISIFIYAHMHKVYEFFFEILEKNY